MTSIAVCLRAARALVMLAAAALLAPALPHAQDDTIRRLMATGTINLGHRESSVPFSYLSARGDVLGSRIGIAGASIGASLAVLAASADTSVTSLALLSPSMDYRGLHIDAAMRKYAERPALLVSSDDDPYATRSVRELQKAAEKARAVVRQVVLLSRAGHGTVMLGRDSDLARTLVDWFRRTLL